MKAFCKKNALRDLKLCDDLVPCICPGNENRIGEKMLNQEHNINPDDLNLYRLVDTAEEAAEHIFRFYNKYVLKPNF